MTNDIDTTQDDAQASLQAFLNAQEFEEMEAALDEYPLLGEPEFEDAVDKLIEHASAMGDTDAVLRFQDRLDILYDVLDNLGATPLEEAVEAFLNAEEGADSDAIYAQYEEWLDSDEAAAFLESMEPADPETAQFLAEKQAVLAGLRAGYCYSVGFPFAAAVELRTISSVGSRTSWGGCTPGSRIWRSSNAVACRPRS